MPYFSTKKNVYLALLLITVLATFVRVYKIDKNPPSLFIDEVSNGYNAYSILKTGRDEYGNFMPLTFRAFGDYNPALSVYLLTPTISVFGLNEWGVRLPSAILGSLSIPVVFLLVLKITQSRKIALIATFLESFDPWHIQFSRYDHEANFMLFFSLLGFTLFLYGLKKHRYLIFSAISFGLCLNTYHAAKIWVPLFVFTLALIAKKDLLKIKSKLIIPTLILFIFSIPFLLNINRSLIRANSVSIFSGKNWPETLANGYLSHFSPDFLFVQGDLMGRHTVDGMGLLYLFEAPLILIGLITIVSGKIKNKKLLFSWFLIAPIPAALSTPTPHALRSISFIPLFSVFLAYGINTLLNFKLQSYKKTLMFFAIGSIALYNIVSYFHLYYFHEPTLKAPDWRYGYKEMINFVNSVKGVDQTIAVSNYYGQPYIYTLFYSKYDPKKYQAQLGNKEHIDNWEFFGSSWERKKPGKIIMVRAPWQTPEDAKKRAIKTIYGPAKEEIFIITEE